MSGGHAGRAHAQWSASASARNFACPGAIAMAERHGAEGKESLAAAWGTACHEISEWALHKFKDPAERIGDVIKTKDHEITVDDEMAETAAVYVIYVRERAKAAAWLKVEQKFDLAAFNLGMDAGGTADAVLFDHPTQTLEVVDLKGGKGVLVEATENFQLRTYALGALAANPGTPAQRVKMTIVQPRAAHRDGIIRFETISVADLLDWAQDLADAVVKASTALATLRIPMPGDTFADTYLRPGDHCRFCPALHACPAVEKKALTAAQAWFSNDGAVKVPDSPESLDTDRLVTILDAADTIQDWLNAVRAYAHGLAEGGTEIPGYILVAKQARRKWIDEDAASAKLMALLQDGELTHTRKIISPAQADKLLGKARAGEIAHLYAAESSGTNLVRADKTNRKAEKPKAQTFFQPE